MNPSFQGYIGQAVLYRQKAIPVREVVPTFTRVLYVFLVFHTTYFIIIVVVVIIIIIIIIYCMNCEQDMRVTIFVLTFAHRRTG